MMGAGVVEPARIVIRGVPDVIDAVPYLIGFEPPPGSVIVALLGLGNRFLASARVDSPTEADWPAYLDAATRMAWWASHEARALNAVIVGIDPADAPDGTGLAITHLANRLTGAGIAVVGVGQRCGRYRREGLEGEWELVPAGVSAAQAELVLAGIAPDASRDAFGALLHPGPRASAALGQAGAARRMPWPAQVAALGQALVGQDPPRPRAAAAAALAFIDPDRRDVLLGLLVPGVVERDRLDPALLGHAAPALDVVTERGGGAGLDAAVRLVQAVPVSLAVGPLLLAGFCAWQTGNLRRASAAMDRVAEIDPGNRLAQLVGRALALGLPIVRPGQAGVPVWAEAGAVTR